MEFQTWLERQLNKPIPAEVVAFNFNLYEDDEEEFSTKRKEGCYIATCVYGSYDCPEVWTLRRYRDEILRKTALGRLFVKIYYAISPKMVKLFGKTSIFKKAFKGYLNKKISRLHNLGISSEKYNDK